MDSWLSHTLNLLNGCSWKALSKCKIKRIIRLNTRSLTAIFITLQAFFSESTINCLRDNFLHEIECWINEGINWLIWLINILKGCMYIHKFSWTTYWVNQLHACMINLHFYIIDVVGWRNWVGRPDCCFTWY